MQTQIAMFDSHAIALMNAYADRSSELFDVLVQGNVLHQLTRVRSYLDQHGAKQLYPWDVVAEPTADRNANDNDASGSGQDVCSAMRESLVRDADYRLDADHLCGLHRAATDLMFGYLAAIIEPNRRSVHYVQQRVDALKAALIEHAGLGKHQASVTARQFIGVMEAIGNDALGPAYPAKHSR